MDAQLNYEDIDDSACENYVSALSRAAPNGSTVPPLDATLAELKAYVENNSLPIFAAPPVGRPHTPAPC
ncbi:MAG: hypothetical protein KatS3mg052_0998 [Candidatus Roseilinea sp.]|nr:MAG: hypothetical protein KatS3mg052_0998 [Candidatus Roseilinea sp.]